MWSTSEQGCIKINFDGASRGNLSILGVGCVARDEEGIILFKGARMLHDETNNKVEVQVALLVVELAANMNVPKVHLEGDSKVVVDTIMKGVSLSWKLNKFITLICSKLNNFQDFCISY